MTPFLQQVAEIYVERESENLADYCFVFPNKRSATFFTRFLEQALARKKGGVLPEITNITDFVAGFSHLTQANRYDMLFTLFDEYRKIPGVEADFDQFVFWGEMLLTDFSDVDRYLVDPDQLFVNVRKLREISSNYLSEQQLEVIRRFWGEERTRETVDRFWNHIDHENDSPRQAKFIKLWEVLQPLFHAFTRRLEERGLATSGRLYRIAGDMLSPESSYVPPMERYIFVGFNVLSTSEIKILSRLQKMGRADFYWDCNSPAIEMKDSRAARFIKRNIKEFPSRYELPEEKINHMPNIRILGVPSNIGQVKAAGLAIDSWAREGKIDDLNNAIDTAVVLPDESLLIPMIHSVPETVGTLNVTMGFPMRLSPMSGLLKTIISLQLRSRMRAGERIYFYEDVKALLTTPALRAMAPAECASLEEQIVTKRLFSIPARLITETVPQLAPVFTPISNSDSLADIGLYITRLCDFLDHTGEDDDKNFHAMQHQFVESYRIAARELLDAARIYGIEMKGSSYFRLIERAISSDTVRFVGEPLRGLQIMGVLETRALDFKNIIMTSMNERVFPRRHYSRSFIPDALRNGFGMATIDFQESIFAYYFYRLISRAENVTLIYDARTVGGSKSSEMSRYLAQLLYFYGEQQCITHNLGVYNAQRFTPQPIVIKKTPEILEKLRRFTPEGGSQNLSASALNTYINCPLNFYLQSVEGYNADNEVTDYMDSSTYGTIVHDSMQQVYESFQNAEREPVTITASMLERFTKKENTDLQRIISRTINKEFNRLDDDKLDAPLVGEALILGRVMHAAIVAMLREDMKLCPFTFIGAEYKMQGTMEVVPGLTVNVKQIIDRIDRVGGVKRFVDYKTGSDVLMAPSIESLFDNNRQQRAKAILQLLLYCLIHNRLTGEDEPIQPVIYKILTMQSRGIEPLKIAKQPIMDYHEVLDDFLDLLTKKILEIFDPEVPFIQTSNPHNCTFCQFKAMCGRE